MCAKFEYLFTAFQSCNNGSFFFKLDLMSDESDTEDQPDEWKKNRTLPPGARDQMRNFANKRGTHHFSCNTIYLIFKQVIYMKFCF